MNKRRNQYDEKRQTKGMYANVKIGKNVKESKQEDRSKFEQSSFGTHIFEKHNYAYIYIYINLLAPPMIPL